MYLGYRLRYAVSAVFSEQSRPALHDSVAASRHPCCHHRHSHRLCLQHPRRESLAVRSQHIHIHHRIKVLLVRVLEIRPHDLRVVLDIILYILRQRVPHLEHPHQQQFHVPVSLFQFSEGRHQFYDTLIFHEPSRVTYHPVAVGYAPSPSHRRQMVTVYLLRAELALRIYSRARAVAQHQLFQSVARLVYQSVPEVNSPGHPHQPSRQHRQQSSFRCMAHDDTYLVLSDIAAYLAYRLHVLFHRETSLHGHHLIAESLFTGISVQIFTLATHCEHPIPLLTEVSELSPDKVRQHEIDVHHMQYVLIVMLHSFLSTPYIHPRIHPPFWRYRIAWHAHNRHPPRCHNKSCHHADVLFRQPTVHCYPLRTRCQRHTLSHVYRSHRWRRTVYLLTSPLY